MVVHHRDKHVHQLHIYVNGAIGNLGEAGEGGREDQTNGSGVSHRKACHLDAGPPKGVPCARGISAGNGSPSAHTAPSSKYSFFQMGTVRLRLSISQRQASNAAARWADTTTMRTLVSPI